MCFDCNDIEAPFYVQSPAVATQHPRRGQFLVTNSAVMDSRVAKTCQKIHACILFPNNYFICACMRNFGRYDKKSFLNPNNGAPARQNLPSLLLSVLPAPPRAGRWNHGAKHCHVTSCTRHRLRIRSGRWGWGSLERSAVRGALASWGEVTDVKGYSPRDMWADRQCGGTAWSPGNRGK